MKKQVLKGLSLLLTLLGVVQASAQQDAQYTQYMYNPQVINPAYAGSREVMSIVGLHRNQWVGVGGSPRTNTLSVNSPLGSVERVGLGASVINDEIGPIDETYFSVDFSYTIPTRSGNKFSFGLKGTAQLLSVNLNLLDVYAPDEERFNQAIDNRISPNVGLGTFYHSEKFYIGLSVPNILETEHYDVNPVEGSDQLELASKEQVNFYLMGGYVFDLSPTVKFKPAVMSKMVFGAPLQLDVSANFMFNEKFIVGTAYRWDAAISGLLGFQLSEGFMIGFGYDYELTDLQEFNHGSYEVMMRFELYRKISRILTPRFF